MICIRRIACGLLLASPLGLGGETARAALPGRDDPWIRVTTANFTLYSDASESETKEIGLNLERLRSVLLLVNSALTANAPVPTTIFVFRSGAAMEPYLPFYRGKPRRVDAYFSSAPDGNYIALCASGDDARPIVYHEYLHYFLRNNFPLQPLWYEEGLAEFYSTFRATDTSADIGILVKGHMKRLEVEALWPLDRLFGVRRDSPEYNEESKQGLFYAESWALVHYLMRSDPKKTAQLGQFLVALQRGRPQEEAFHEAFQTDYATLLTGLTRYIRGNGFAFARLSFPKRGVPSEARAERMPYEDALWHLGDLLLHGQDERLKDAESYFQSVLLLNASHAGALGGLGALRIRQKRYDEGADLLRRAAASGSADFRTYFYLGEIAMRSLSAGALEAGRLDAGQRRALDEARSAFRRCLELNGEFAEAHAALGKTYLAEGGSRSDEGIDELETAVRRLPSRRDVAMDLVALYDRRGDRAKADDLLRSVLGPEAAPVLAERRKRDDFEATKERINVLLRENKEDEAVALLERLVQTSSGASRETLSAQLDALRRGAARNRSVRRYNEGVTLLNQRDYAGAIGAFREVAATAEDPELAKAAQERADSIERSMPGKKGKKASAAKS